MDEIIDRTSWKPILIPSENLGKIKEQHPAISIVDQYRKNSEELFLLRNPKYRFNQNHRSSFESFWDDHTNGASDNVGGWYYYPWLNQVVHFLPDAMHQELRTGRNRNLITEAEQYRYYNKAKSAFLGMSVGSHIALSTAMSGGMKKMKIADPDTISGDNLNRINTGFQNVGINKAIAVARQIYELNPYASLDVFSDGLNAGNMDEILSGVDIVIEEMDDLFWKLKIREKARTLGIPVIMGTDNGDGIIVDIERFDMNNSYPLLHGKIRDLQSSDCRKIDPKDLPRIYAKVAGASLAVPRMLTSVAEVGKTLYSWPQLGTAANLCGTVITYLARSIVLGDTSIKSGRYQVDLDKIFRLGHTRRQFNQKIEFTRFLKKMKKNG